jgi:uncharacterized protein (TIGR02646 family)
MDSKANPTATFGFPDHWNEADVRGALYATHGKVCAYCGCKLPGNDRGDVDHFRPKGSPDDDRSHGGYWWLAYTLDNYLLSCSPCNSNCKINRFPIRPGAIRILYSSRAQLLSEARLLIDPARDSVEKWLRVDWEHPLCKVRHSDNLTKTTRARVDKTLDFFRINIDPRLVGERIDVRDSVIADLDQGRVDVARMKAIRYRPHSLVAFQVLRDLGHPLPTKGEELQWLLTDLLTDLDLVTQILEEGPSNLATKRMTELLWSLAFLWQNPPVGSTRAGMKAILKQKGVIEAVKEYKDLLP